MSTTALTTIERVSSVCVCVFVCVCVWVAAMLRYGGPPSPLQRWLASLLTWKHQTHTKGSRATPTHTLSHAVAFRRALAELLAPLALASDRKCVPGTNQSESSGERVWGSCGFRAKKVLALLRWCDDFGQYGQRWHKHESEVTVSLSLDWKVEVRTRLQSSCKEAERRSSEQRCVYCQTTTVRADPYYMSNVLFSIFVLVSIVRLFY